MCLLRCRNWFDGSSNKNGAPNAPVIESKSTASLKAMFYISVFPLKETVSFYSSCGLWEDGQLRRKLWKNYALGEKAAPHSCGIIVLSQPYVTCISYSMKTSAVWWWRRFSEFLFTHGSLQT